MTDDERKRLRAEAARKKAAAVGSGKTGAVKAASGPQASENKKKSAVKAAPKKGLSRGKVVRRTVAGLMLASAAFIAAIPEDKSGRTAAVGTSATGNGPDYAAAEVLAENGELLPGDSNTGMSIIKALDPNDPAHANKYYSYQVTDISGEKSLLWQYKFYTDTINNIPDQGIICLYDDTYAVEALDLTQPIVTGYDFVSATDYSNYVTSTLGSIQFRMDSYPNDPANQAQDQINRKYFGQEYEAWVDTYNAAVADWQAQGNTGYPSTDVLNISAFDKTGAQMTDSMQKLYYCDHNVGRDNQSLAGYTLEGMTNNAKNSEYYSGTDSTGVVTGTIPNDSTIYIVKKYDDSADPDTLDPNGYKMLGRIQVTAISDGAFKSTKRVNRMTIGGSVAYIGDEAFEDSFLQDVDLQSVIFVGNKVFKDCTKLTSFTLNNNATTIGKEAFKGCKVLDNVSIPTGVTQIGFGAFADCPILSSVDMADNHGLNIGEYAFYNCPKLSSVSFPADYDVSIGTAAFALADGTGTGAAMTDFTFPERLGTYKSAINDAQYTAVPVYNKDGSIDGTYASRMGDYILSGRDGLTNVTFPVDFGSSSEEYVPGGTFHHCKDLGGVFFGKKGQVTEYNSYVKFGSGLLTDVQNEKVFVYGPEHVSGTYDPAMPRESTWEAVSSVAEYVPYVYYAREKEHYEVGIYPYRYELEINGGDATILNCERIDGLTTPIDELIIPNQVGDYRITALGDGSMEDIKDYVVKLSVSDNSIETIGADVFRNCANLEEVDLGNGVKNIGNNAFSDNAKLRSVTISPVIETVGDEAFAANPRLENVIWEEPSSFGTMTSIGTDAFRTDGNKLYFTGAVSRDYEPFKYAMGNNRINNANSVRICYKETAPYNFYIIHDDAKDTNLLIDYPQYKDIPQSTRSKFESGQMLTQDELAEIEASKYLYVPEAVDSLDVVSFLDATDSSNPNKVNWIYLQDRPNPDDQNNTRISVYGSGIGDSYPGLFSGFVNEAGAVAADGEAGAETATKGNDWIKLIDLPGVKSIPDHCFDSCERLESVTISPNCDDIGEGAFSGCTNLSSIGTNGNPKYDFDKCILYEKKDDGTLELNTCLPYRGLIDKSEKLVSPTSDPNLLNVSSIKEGAFEGCKNITKVTLWDEKNPDDPHDDVKVPVEVIPQDCFKDCTYLYSVTLPDTVKSIKAGAFDGCNNTFEVTIPSDALISDTAFNKSAVENIIKTYKDECPLTWAYDPVDYDNITKVDLKKTVYFTVTFLNDDQSVFWEDKVRSGSDYYPPNYNNKSYDPEPKLFDHFGWTFKVWKGKNDQVTYQYLASVSADKTLLAVFEKPSGSAEPKDLYEAVLELNKAASKTVSSPEAIQELAADSNEIIPTYEKLDDEAKDGISINAANSALKNAMDKLVKSLPLDSGITMDNGNLNVEKDKLEQALAGPNGDAIRKAVQEYADTVKAISDKMADVIYEYLKNKGESVNPPVTPTEIPLKDPVCMYFKNDDGTTIYTSKVERNGLIPFSWSGETPTPATAKNKGKVFNGWKFYTVAGNKDISKKKETVIYSPDQDKYAVAQYKNDPSGSKNSGNSGSPTPTPKSNSSNSASQNGTLYNVIVENGAGSGEYAVGKVVTITAYSAPDGKVFDRWTTSNSDVGFGNIYNVSTTFIMPSHNVKVTATYKNRSASSNSANSANSANNRASASNSGSSSSGRNNGNNGGTDVRITTDAIDNNKKNLGYATVAGSTDNFVLKITDSAAATAAVEKALRQKYGDDFDNIKYSAFDISLYDETGENKIANANDLAVTITMPIPDDLVGYAGNNKAGAVVNDMLEEKAATFTTIDGVPCIKFTATHFSPYTIYVDTGNLVRGINDATPKTGEGVSPKWFLSGGLTSLSALLFLWQDKKKVKKTKKAKAA